MILGLFVSIGFKFVLSVNPQVNPLTQDLIKANKISEIVSVLARNFGQDRMAMIHFLGTLTQAQVEQLGFQKLSLIAKVITTAPREGDPESEQERITAEGLARMRRIVAAEEAKKNGAEIPKAEDIVSKKGNIVKPPDPDKATAALKNDASQVVVGYKLYRDKHYRARIIFRMGEDGKPHLFYVSNPKKPESLADFRLALSKGRLSSFFRDSIIVAVPRTDTSTSEREYVIYDRDTPPPNMINLGDVEIYTSIHPKAVLDVVVSESDREKMKVETTWGGFHKRVKELQREELSFLKFSTTVNIPVITMQLAGEPVKVFDMSVDRSNEKKVVLHSSEGPFEEYVQVPASFTFNDVFSRGDIEIYEPSADGRLLLLTNFPTGRFRARAASVNVRTLLNFSFRHPEYGFSSSRCGQFMTEFSEKH